MALAQLDCFVWGGDSGGNKLYIDFIHSLNATTIYRKIIYNDTTLIDDSFAATSQGSVFDSTATFTLDGKTASLKAYNNGVSNNIAINCVLTIDGVVSYFAMMDKTNRLGPRENLTNPYEMEINIYIE